MENTIPDAVDTDQGAAFINETTLVAMQMFTWSTFVDVTL